MKAAGSMNGHKPNPAVLNKPRARRDAAKALAMALRARLQRLYDAQTDNDENAIVAATGDLAIVMYENVEFVIWALKVQGGLNPPPPEMLKPISKHAAPVYSPANDPIPLPTECTCPPLEHGILFRDKHMTSCPKYVP